MKSDFMMAINQVCHERQLPPEVVLEAVEVALVSAYKRNYGSNRITAKVDQNTGTVKIYVEKEVVEDVLDDKNEISLSDARVHEADAEMGDVIQVESTPANFGRIAAQTTKQVILQRIREAEREALYRTYAEREGEIVNGTVHKIDSHQVILSLGKVEAILPRSEQIPSERYTAGQRSRAYVSEVSRTPRGPQIIVSRTHRNMLRRLLEVEVPEIYNGTVEIKAIAREAGYRSKVAVAALQDGVDPVGSCVGMRGVRIQSIVSELGGEKIDVAEWSPDTRVFIANSLSPAKVLNVILHDIGGDKTASVVVPDKQLSLAIGKEGQNARLAAKLTGWRIDIKSALEAVQEAMERARASEEIKALVSNRPEVFALVSDILAEKEEGADLSTGELNLVSEAIELIGQAEVSVAREKYEAEKRKKEAKKAQTKNIEIDILAEADAILKDVNLEVTEPLEVADVEETPVAEATVESEILEQAEEVLSTLEEETVVEEQEPSEPSLLETSTEPVAEDEGEANVDAADAPDTEVSDAEEYIPSIIESIVEEPPKKKESKKRIKPVFVSSDFMEDDLDPLDKKKAKSKGRTLEYDEELGEVVVKRKRKKSRARDEWEDYLG